MKKIQYYFLTVFLAVTITPVVGQNDQNKFDIRLDNGKYMRLEACSEKIIRIRMSPQNEFPESLMERYELVNTDWQKILVVN